MRRWVSRVPCPSPARVTLSKHNIKYLSKDEQAQTLDLARLGSPYQKHNIVFLMRRWASTDNGLCLARVTYDKYINEYLRNINLPINNMKLVPFYMISLSIYNKMYKKSCGWQMDWTKKTWLQLWTVKNFTCLGFPPKSSMARWTHLRASSTSPTP